MFPYAPKNAYPRDYAIVALKLELTTNPGPHARLLSGVKLRDDLLRLDIDCSHPVASYRSKSHSMDGCMCRASISEDLLSWPYVTSATVGGPVTHEQCYVWRLGRVSLHDVAGAALHH
jgi:hypothetical protein